MKVSLKKTSLSLAIALSLSGGAAFAGGWGGGGGWGSSDTPSWFDGEFEAECEGQCTMIVGTLEGPGSVSSVTANGGGGGRAESFSNGTLGFEVVEGWGLGLAGGTASGGANLTTAGSQAAGFAAGGGINGGGGGDVHAFNISSTDLEGDYATCFGPDCDGGWGGGGGDGGW